MTTSRTEATKHPRRPLRSVGAILAGLVTVVVLSLGTDQVLHTLNVYPPWGQPMYDPGLNLLALAYRCLFAVGGGYVAARLAPHAPVHHAFVLGVIGLIPSVAGIVATSGMDLGPRWYPIALALTALPCTWLGGFLHRARRAAQ